MPMAETAAGNYKALTACREEPVPNEIMQWSKIKPRTVIPGFVGRFIHSDTMTFVLWEIAAGAVLPDHAHIHEQVVHLYEGEFEMTVEDKTMRLSSGMVFAIPANARHHGHAITDCRVMDVFYPIREDYRDGAGSTILASAAERSA
jgi:quercetin dioxygenase-like cupin family protein